MRHSLIPADIPHEYSIPQEHQQDDFVALAIGADGDCLPHCGSLFAFGHEKWSQEIRARIIIELVLHKDDYLSPEYLRRGINATDRQASKLPSKYAMMSDSYIPGNRLNEGEIDHLYQQIMQIIEPRSFMGIWQLFGLSSVLGVKIFSTYPKLGNPNIRSDLHRLIYPRIARSVTNIPTSTILIMWTSTRPKCDMRKKNWIPNHFVPVVPSMSEPATRPEPQPATQPESEAVSLEVTE